MRNKTLNVLVIYNDRVRCKLIEKAFSDEEHYRFVKMKRTAGLLGSVKAISPDVIIIDAGKAKIEELYDNFNFTKKINKPIVMFSSNSDLEIIRKAIKAGVNAYVFDELKSENVIAVIEVAVNRYEDRQEIIRERDEARLALEERKVIERAKGILMRNHSYPEDKAYNFLRENAMKQNKRMINIAESIITADAINFI